MNEAELKRLQERQNHVVSHRPFEIAAFSWSDDESDRTLLYGYDVDRNSWHVYVKDRKVHLHVYNTYDNSFVPVHRTEFTSYQELVPNKRLYPERCDYEFCRFLIVEKKVYLSFLNWDQDRMDKVAAMPAPMFNPYHGEPAKT